MSDHTYDLKLLEQGLEKWRASRSIRFFYEDVFRSMMSMAVEGDTLDLGSGIGVIKEFFPEVVTSDIEKTPYVDLQLSCYDLEAGGRRWNNLLATDVLHHLSRPLDFFGSASASLKEKGRLIMTEPAATPFGRIFYRAFHHEPMHLESIVPPFQFDSEIDLETGEFANMAMAYGLIYKNGSNFNHRLSECGLILRDVIFRDFLGYPLTGGFSRPSFLPPSMIRLIIRLENKLPQSFLRLIGLRMILILEKISDGRNRPTPL